MRMRLVTAVAFLWVSGSSPVLTQAPTFSAAVNHVRVDVLVTDRGQIVRGLQPSDFEVLDNGVSQRVELVTFEQVPLNVILALDLSESVSGERLDHLRSAARALLDGLSERDQAALLTFSHKVRLKDGLTSNINRLKQSLEEAEPAGNTALIDGAFAAMMLGASGVGRDLVILFSDGFDTASWLPASTVLESARRADVVVYAVSARGPAPFLRDVTGLTGGTSFEVDSTKDLRARFTAILEEFRQRYLVSYSPQGVSKDGWHRLDVHVKGRRAAVKARAGYLAGASTSRR
jgi:Ca-activated chloride channel homolog